jgi:alpha-tubulin suppressor-like RCC1 family protein
LFKRQAGRGPSAISAGDEFTCALTTAGGARGWGYNFWGQLGDNTTQDSEVPVGVVWPLHDYLPLMVRHGSGWVAHCRSTQAYAQAVVGLTAPRAQTMRLRGRLRPG